MDSPGRGEVWGAPPPARFKTQGWRRNGMGSKSWLKIGPLLVGGVLLCGCNNTRPTPPQPNFPTAGLTSPGTSTGGFANNNVSGPGASKFAAPGANPYPTANTGGFAQPTPGTGLSQPPGTGFSQPPSTGVSQP